MDSKREKRTFSEKEISDAFHSMDVDGNGFISAGDIRVFYRAIGEELTDEEVQFTYIHAHKHTYSQCEMMLMLCSFGLVVMID
jgi:Ca2+-binding EF-hand superfamily protein